MKTKPIQLLLLFTLFIVIYSCEKDDSVIKQQNYLKTVALSEAKDFLRQSQEQSKSNPEGSFITSLSDEITYEDLTNTDEQVAVIPVTTQYSKLNSRLVLLTINGKLESAVVSLNPFENSTVNSFSGELLITDTDGRFIKAFKIENNVYMAEYVNNNSKSKESNKLENYNTLKDTGGSCRCVFSVCDYCQLEEVVIVVESTTPRIPTPYVSITHMYNTGGAGDEATGNEWDLGGSGSGYTDYSPDPEDCPEGYTRDSSGECVEDPTPCETALLSRDVYSTEDGQQENGTEPIPQELSGGWELNNTLDLSSLTLTDNDSGFNSAVYQKLVNGVYQYMYVTEGTNTFAVEDWYNNIRQVSGTSAQYEISVQNAQLLNSLVGSRQLYFTGHSLGGGLASVNSLATGRTAFTYNAAGISSSTRNLYDNGLNPEINATVVSGEIVDRIQSEFNIKAEDSDTINYIDEESTFWKEFFNESSSALNTYKAIRLHFIQTVIDILDCE